MRWSCNQNLASPWSPYFIQCRHTSSDVTQGLEDCVALENRSGREFAGPNHHVSYGTLFREWFTWGHDTRKIKCREAHSKASLLSILSQHQDFKMHLVLAFYIGNCHTECFNTNSILWFCQVSSSIPLLIVGWLSHFLSHSGHLLVVADWKRCKDKTFM